MKEQVEKVLADVFTKHADRRLDLFKVQVESADASGIKLAGRVLTPESVEETRQGLAAALPGVAVDVSGVRVLRAKPGPTYTVATTLTDLHVEPSFLSELLTQVVNGTPLEVLDEHTDGKWVFVRQTDGYLGWAYKPYLTAGAPKLQPTHIVTGFSGLLSDNPGQEFSPVTLLMAGTLVRLIEQQGSRAHVQVEGPIFSSGWISTSAIRSLEKLPIKDSPVTAIIGYARVLTGTYYLWGGTSQMGIDCSGLAQLTHKLCGYTLPRDADMQFKAGTPVEGPYQVGDLFFFHSDTNKDKITHVAICTGGWNMIHSSRSRNGVYEEDLQANETYRKVFAGARTFLPR